MAESKDTFEIEKTDVEDLVSSQEDFLKKIPPWSEQITVRGLFASLVIGVLYSIIVMKLVLTTGLVPALNVSAALLAYVLLRTWTRILNKIGFSSEPFTKQENTIVQTCAVACYSISQGGGFGSYLLGLNKKTYELAGGAHSDGNSPGSYKEPAVGWITGFLFVTCFVGLLVLVPLRKVMIIDYKLTFPNGTATAVLIEGFHTSKGDKMAKKQVRGFTKFFSYSFLWGFFKWFYSGGEKCGFAHFPTFGLQAWRQTFFFDFNMTYIGAGMICPHIVNLSLLFGAVMSWGILWPLILRMKGEWYPDNLPENNMKSLQGYKVFIPIAILLGDGLYNLFKIFSIIIKSVHLKASGRGLKPDQQSEGIDDLHRNETFMRDSIPLWIAFSGYAFFSVISAIAIPRMFPQIRWYYVVLAYIFAPPLAFCNAYGAGLTDMNLAYNYGKIALFILAAWAGKDSGVVAGLVGCGVVKSIVSISADLMHDFKTGYLTLSSPRAMVISQAVGTAMGCVVAPLSFFLFYKAFDVGNPDGEFKAPFALIYRNMVILGVEGFSALPDHCLQLCCVFFFFAIGTDLVKDLSPPKYGKWIPLPMAVAVPFLVGAYFAIDMFVGTVIVFVWQKLNSDRATLMVPAVASGLICGEGLWTLPSSILALAKVDPPICMTFHPH